MNSFEPQQQLMNRFFSLHNITLFFIYEMNIPKILMIFHATYSHYINTLTHTQEMPKKLNFFFVQFRFLIINSADRFFSLFTFCFFFSFELVENHFFFIS